MSDFLIYLIKSTIYLGLFYAFFLLVMRNTTFFRFNRMMLLFGTLVCMLLPCYTITVSQAEGIQLPIQMLNETLSSETPYIATESEIMEHPLQEVSTMDSKTLLPAILLGFHLLGMTVYSTMAIRSFAKVWKLISSHPKQRKDGYWLVVIPDKIPSFSWNRYIVMSEDDYQHHPQVLIHEQMHCRCRHTFDILYFTIVQAFHWFNPMVWLIRTELKQLHEFEADNGVVNQGIDATQYQLLLVQKAVGKKLYTIANGFNHTKLQKRITMMIQEKSNGRERLKWLVTVPIVTSAMLVFAQPEASFLNEKLTVSGQVFEAETNDVLPAVRIIVEGTTEVTYSDAYGKFNIQANKGDVIIMNFAGCKTQSFVVKDETPMKILMKANGKPVSEFIKEPGNNKKENVQEAKSSPSTFVHKKREDGVYYTVDELPEYPGGINAMQLFISQHFKQPSNKGAGYVLVGFVIDTDGSIRDAKIMHSASEETDVEALRVVGLMPKFKPAKVEGKAVPMVYNIPIRIK